MGSGAGMFEIPLYAPSHWMFPTTVTNSMANTVVMMTKVNPAFLMMT